MKEYFEELKQEKGNPFVIAIFEAIVFFCSTFGFSDYILNTIFFKKTGWVDDLNIPGSLVTAYLFPGIVNAAIYLSGGIEYDLKTLVICVIVEMLGSIVGSHLVLNLDVSKLKKLIGYAMIFSMFALLGKLIISSGVSGTASGIHGWQFVIAIPVVFIFGLLNMMGVPMKPPLMCMFLLMGVSPLVVITLLMCMAVPGPIAGSINIFKSGRYSKRTFVIAATVGSCAAVFGGLFALSVNTLLLTILMMIGMGIVAYNMLKK